jgi:predicted P-loop ATPase
MINDRLITISHGNSRKSTNWQPQTLLLSELYVKLQTPTRGTETLAEYMALKKSRQDDLKDVGGFVGGTLSSARRKANNVIGRDIVTLDLDNIPAGGTEDLLRRVEGLGCGYCVYSTRKHHAAAPRLRVIIPLERTVTADEYEPCARKLAEYIGIEMADPSTFEASRLMYWPSCSADSAYVYLFADKPFASAEGLLAVYADWRDVTAWPTLPGAQAHKVLAAKQGDPEEKKGVVGAFCRVYDIYRAIDELLPGIYEPVDNSPGRYTYVDGSTVGGAVIYDEGKFLFSHHATDPCSGRLVNAFDLVRLHRFADLDDSDAVKDGTPTNRLPSFQRMCMEAVQDAKVSALITEERYARAFDDLEEKTVPADTEWAKKLTLDQNGNLHKTLNNIALLIENAPELYGCTKRDDFSGRLYATEDLPWRTEKGYWSDADTTELRKFFERKYDGFRPGKQDIKDSVVACSVAQHFHPVREYLTGLVWDGVPRLDTLFIDYLGVADSPYSRAVTRKALVGAVARIMTPGCKFDYMPVFVGKQGRGKSSIIYKLAGIDGWFTDSLVTFDGNKAFEAVTGKWLVEVPEMHAFDKTTMNQAKAFITKQSDFYRAAYAEFPEDRQRQCIFFGTTNNADCLRDETGGRRFWPLDTDAVERKKNIFSHLDTERDQLWAEAVVYWRMGETLYLPPELEAKAAEQQEAHREAHPWEDTVRNFVEREIPIDWDTWDLNQRMTYWGGTAIGELVTIKRTKVCALEVWREALMCEEAKFDRQKAREICGVLNNLPGWERGGTVRCGNAYGPRKAYVRRVT